MTVRGGGRLVLLALAASACGRSTGHTVISMPVVDAGAAADAGDSLGCGPGVDSPPSEGQLHVAEPTPVIYAANPPASGPHWPMWQEPWGAYPDGVPRERWVHNLEHGGVVLLYNCPSGCDDVVTALNELREGTRPDQYNEQRLLVLPDAQMPHKVAAVAWLWRWQGEAVDRAALRCFVDARYDHAPESIP